MFITYRDTSAIILWGAEAFIVRWEELLQPVSICRTSPSSSEPLHFSPAALTHLLHQILTDRRPFLHYHCCILSQCVGFVCPLSPND
ncbi:hypothetical protein GDO81_019024 [Engystomops pustulosus]|uniref:Uncharacterized protein n=1 Tax=Engystomops pustulosus TaxID=76066 RepID=A0AAV6YKS8_ENGPU|nr:hypothetical protein GDO81_019024 [Engystomops pustulosus]